MTNPDLNTLALGTDLTTMGLDLNSPDCLFTTFASPWADAPAAQSRPFNLPACYMQSPPSLKTSHLNKFQLETLFHIFYSMPTDILQAYAAQELYNREWRYHRDMRLWFTEARQPDNTVSSKPTVSLLIRTASSIYIPDHAYCLTEPNQAQEPCRIGRPSYQCCLRQRNVLFDRSCFFNTPHLCGSLSVCVLFSHNRSLRTACSTYTLISARGNSACSVERCRAECKVASCLHRR